MTLLVARECLRALFTSTFNRNVHANTVRSTERQEW